MKFPSHKASLHLTHNQHKSYYQSAAEYADRLDWISDEEKQKAIATDEIWELQWYPETPIGFCCLAASDLELLLLTASEDYNFKRRV